MKKQLFAIMLALAATSAQAAGGKQAAPENAKWKAECGSCHIAFPAKLLTADNWKSMMGNLHKHFGTNAEIDAKDHQEILSYLTGNAGSGERHSANSLRISDTPWFKREHREVSAKAWSHASVKTPANCAACHVKADKGDWSERSIRMPAGLQHEHEREEEEEYYRH